jgi:hypothetical protein
VPASGCWREGHRSESAVVGWWRGAVREMPSCRGAGDVEEPVTELQEEPGVGSGGGGGPRRCRSHRRSAVWTRGAGLQRSRPHWAAGGPGALA